MRETLYSYCKRTGMERLLNEWADDPCSPQTVTYGSKRQVWWTCKAGHRWQARIVDRVRETGCPYCSGTVVMPGVNDLAAMAPQIAREWHPARNGELKPDQVHSQSNRRVWWLCENGHSWQALVSARVAGCGCPYCSGKRVLPGVNDLAALVPELAAEWSEKNGLLTPGDVRPASNKMVWWRCEKGHTWQAKVNDRIKNQSGCPYCNNRKVAAGFNDLMTKAPEIAAQWYQPLNGALTPQTVLAGSRRKVWWICEQGHVWDARISSRTGQAKSGCPVCAGNVSRKAKERYERIVARILSPDGS